ncbi:hypothetical protein Hbl1158_14860 [Halobaculum sp. CBA1158]|uniref:hypothetical protein n=1 Tax=Halobaculum sp. CBA1158 TaxID=2904243 RepID=UPI001F27E48A|nr:hypothetical protein [Halobaculum sp. CBA1158]UIO99781.1 hypothetical protein Hbl1158_14860 [Halobaculum sp. CBA1158]
MKSVFYHHPVFEDFSLKAVGESPSDLREYVDRRASGEFKFLGYPFDEPVYVVYGRDTENRNIEDLQLDRDWLESEIDSLSLLGRFVMYRLIELLEAAVDERDSEGFNLYKELQPRQIDNALVHVDWGAMLPTVAGDLMANLILRHSLPNANHRTAIAMLQFCIEAVDGSFSMPRTHIDDDNWQEWVDPYILDSKRLLTVRRNNVRFQKLVSLDVDGVTRKDGIEIRLSNYDLDMPFREARSHYAKVHELHCRSFAVEVLDKAGRTDLTAETGPTRDDLRTYLEVGVHKHEFTDVFS